MEWLPKNDGAKQKRFSLFGYLKETKQELKRVTWPTKKLFKNTSIVLTVVISCTILVWGIDTILSGALALLLK
ncbi:preprotein translocase subunit SecE [Clostridioides difficile]|nr:preprotein translocase subunit SecE [Clostridioides difficile]